MIEPEVSTPTGRALRRFKAWFWRPPRPHGDTIVDRRVSPLELLYDLVYVAVISQAGLHVAERLSLIRVVHFAVVFSLTWIAWTNGSLYLELHGRSDGRTRTYVFLQMGILVVLAVFARGAADEAGPAFALTYSAFLAVMAWLWYAVRRQDLTERPDLADETGRYVLAMAGSAALMFASAFLPSALRLMVWVVLVVGWVAVLLLMGASRVGLSRGMTPTDSLVERFGTFVIIVLGEVVFGVVEGLSLANRDLETMVTGMIALVVGLGFWWIYFDVIGGRLPKGDGRALANWILGHHPVALSIAAAGVGMVSLITHAHDRSTPAPTAWLLSGAVSLGLIALVPIARALSDAARLATVYKSFEIAAAAGAVACVLIGVTEPAPWLLALLLVLVLSLVWAVAIRGYLLAGASSARQVDSN